LYAAVFALPGGYFLTEAIFQFFAYRPNLSLWVPAGVFVFILICAFFTISLQTVKAAITTPASILREE
jgi:putative ABC transport system permease protein